MGVTSFFTPKKFKKPKKFSFFNALQQLEFCELTLGDKILNFKYLGHKKFQEPVKE